MEVPIITCSPYNPVATKNVNPYAESATVDGASKYSMLVVQYIPNSTVKKRKVAGSIPTGFSEFFIDIKSFRSHYGPGVDSASNRSEYQEYFLGVKAADA